MTATDDLNNDDALAAHLRRALRAVAATVTDDPAEPDFPGEPRRRPTRRSRRYSIRRAAAVDVEPAIDQVLDPAPVALVTGRRARRRHRLAVLAAGAAAAAALAVTALSIGGPGRRGVDVETPAPRARSSTAADTHPRFLVTRPGWKVLFVDESTTFSEITYKDDAGHGFVLARYSATEAERREAEIPGSQTSWTATIAGREATVYETPYGGDISYSAWWRDGDDGFELRSDTFASAAEYRAVVATFVEVDSDTWLAALPLDVVHPDDRATAVESVLAELPVPPGLDVEALAAAGSHVSTSHQLRSEVTNAVICGWVQQWVDATEAGDAAARREAVDAMASSHDWPPLVDAAGGPWTTYIWDVADAMVADVPLDAYPSLPQGTGYQRHVGCPED